ncbi:hypothetical protein [Actinomadura sp. 7K534]|uniref:hypothetical protein n=1 Tax=Actinomadura sp. 7K534 TaxID=2530366 RepID=UPI00104CECF4|nr:hypothetical protein [Actinomadura sp. 7K534]TDB96170.1 hypothetical protein E1266_10765 [Actinomadura sp. 7K534]
MTGATTGVAFCLPRNVLAAIGKIEQPTPNRRHALAPSHIGAALLRHPNIRTTRGHVAVIDEDVVTGYTAFLATRRAIRPHDEYHDATTEEWQEFEEHFGKRKVELRSCERPYGTPASTNTLAQPN